jgi:hypothetical protein
MEVGVGLDEDGRQFLLRDFFNKGFIFGFG